MYKYYYVPNSDGTIKSLWKAKKAPEGGVQTTKANYERYLAIIRSVPDREGYDKIVHLYPDFTFTVEYLPIEVVIVDDEGDEE